MISIIICSRTETLPSAFIKNIEDTVGVEHELIIIDNSKNNYSIFEAYNLGIKKSVGAYLCFIHDDILFYTQNWGKRLEDIFEKDKKLGLIGVAGSKVKTKTPSAWWDCPHDQMVVNIIHQAENKLEKQYHGFDHENNVEVVLIDGVFMAGRANKDIKFNAAIKEFHGYDLNLSIAYKKIGFKIIVTNTILLKHLSLGKVDSNWTQSALKLYKVFKNDLPLMVGNTLTKTELKKIEFKNGMQFCDKLMEIKCRKEALLFWIKSFFIKPKSKLHFKFLKSYIKGYNE